MNRLPPTRIRLPARGICLAAAAILGGAAASAEDIIQTKNAVYRGTVLKADAQNVHIKLEENGNQIGVPRATILRSRVATPPEVVAGLKAFDERDMKTAYTALRGIMPRFIGLDADWAARGTIALGRSAIARERLDEADKVFRAFLSLHPGHPLRIGGHLGRAEVQLARGEHAGALELFRKLAATYENTLKPDAANMELAAQAWMGAARAAEGLQQWTDALDAYIKVVTLYPAENDYEEALFRSALIRVKLGAHTGASAALEELIEDFPQGPYHQLAVQLKARIPTETGG